MAPKLPAEAVTAGITARPDTTINIASNPNNHVE